VDAVELRLDLYPDVDVDAFVRQCGKPVVVAVRRVVDGGRWDRGEEERGRLLRRASAAAFIDLEVDADPALAPAGPRRVVSFHAVDGMPRDLDLVFQRCLVRGGDVVKIAARPASAVDAFRLVDLPTAGLALGDYGAFTRVLAPWTGCRETSTLSFNAAWCGAATGGSARRPRSTASWGTRSRIQKAPTSSTRCSRSWASTRST
jgi:3-dehydroquinate dehydratase type I